MSSKHTQPVARSNLAKDLTVFGQPGFWVSLLLVFAMLAIGAAILLHSTAKYAIPPF